MRATKKLIQENIRLNNHLVAARCEIAELRSLCDDAYGLIMDHHAEGQMVPNVCTACTHRTSQIIVKRLENIRKSRNRERHRQVVANLVYSKLGPRQLDELGDDE